MESCSGISTREQVNSAQDKILRGFFANVIDDYGGYFMFSFIDDPKTQKAVRDYVAKNSYLFIIWGKGTKTGPVIVQLKPALLAKFNFSNKKTTKASSFAKAIDSILITAIRIEKDKGRFTLNNYYIDSRINTAPSFIPENHVIITTNKRMTDLRQLYPHNSFYIPKYLECFYF